MSDAGYWGQQRGLSAQTKFNELWFVLQTMMARNATTTLVQVKACSNAGGVSPVGTVDVQPLVHQLDGSGNIMPHGIVYGLPYLRLQGGSSAVIMDPKPGDIGIAVFASSDISKVKSTKAAAAPGSFRRFDMADGLYLGGVLNGTPTRYVRFTDSGIEIVDPSEITLTAPTINLNASTKVMVTSPDVELGGTGGPAVARVGDTVSGGVITSGSAKVKAT